MKPILSILIIVGFLSSCSKEANKVDEVQIITTSIAWLMIILSLWNLIYPWKRNQPKAKYSIHTPLLIVPLWIVYEVLMPANMNIRADIIILAPLFAFSFTVYLIKLYSYRTIINK